MSAVPQQGEAAMDDPVVVERPETGIVRVILNRPGRKNALSTALRDRVSDALDTIAADETVKVIILTGAGNSFSAGFDLNEFAEASRDEPFKARLWASSDRYHLTLLHFPLPVIAAVNGPALGGGFDTAVLCDIRLAGHSARFGHPEAAFGDVVYGPLHDLVGGSVARDLCLTGRLIDAGEALRLDLVAAVVEDETLAEAALRMAAGIARAPRPVLMRSKAKFIARAAVGFSTTLEL